MSSHTRISQLNTVKSVKRPINGVLLLDKPYGITSNRALQVVKRIYSAAKSGHTGTLDPMATGLLPICFGEATKFSSILLGGDKTYEAKIKLGYISTTGDAEGEVSQSEQSKAGAVMLTLPQCKTILQCFMGKIMQMPPMYSALKYKGKPLYIYARKGEEIERLPREVIIHDLHVNSLIENELQITVRCGSGTYIRTLAEDIGKALGYGGAYLVKLCRSGMGRFDLSQVQTLDALESMTTIHRDSCLYPVDSLLHNFPALILADSAAMLLLQGRAISNYLDTNDWLAGQNFRLYNQEKQFLGLGEMTAERTIIPKRLLANSASKNN